MLTDILTDIMTDPLMDFFEFGSGLVVELNDTTDLNDDTILGDE